MRFRVKLEPQAKWEIQQGITWYNEQKRGLGKRFFSEVVALIENLKFNPYFQIRYDKVRCLPLKNFPYMIHFTVHEDENTVVIHAVLNTWRKPKK